MREEALRQAQSFCLGSSDVAAGAATRVRSKTEIARGSSVPSTALADETAPLRPRRAPLRRCTAGALARSLCACAFLVLVSIASELSSGASNSPTAATTEGVAADVSVQPRLAASEIFAQLAEKHAAVTHFASQAQAAAQAAAAQAAGQAAERLAETRSELRQAAQQAAAQFSERLTVAPAALSAAAERLGERREALHRAAGETMRQLSSWKAKGVAEGQAALTDAVAQASVHLSEQQAKLRDAVAAVREQLAERQAVLAKTASEAATQLAHFCVGCGQDALRQAAAGAAAGAAALLDEHEAQLRESAATIAATLADLQATLSPSAGRVAAQLSELQRRFHELRDGELAAACRPTEDGSEQRCLASEVTLRNEPAEPKPFALPWLLAVREILRYLGAELPVALALLAVVALCVGTTVYAVARNGGEDECSLSYGNLLRRAAWWLVHRVCMGLALLLLSDAMAQAPFNIQRHDAMGWPMWSTLLALSSQLCFFVPAAAALNAAVARGPDCYATPASRRHCAGLSREVHAAIVGCFVSDWMLFPTDLIFLGHHVLGLGIIFGVWSMVLGEARLLSGGIGLADRGSDRSVTAINFWLVTGLSVASMEASSSLYNLYSVMSFGAFLNVSLFAVYMYSNLLSIMCVLSQHPWGTSIKVIWAAGNRLNDVVDRVDGGARAMFPRVLLPWWLSSKTTSDSVSYLWKSLMVVLICLARHHQMWVYVRETLPSAVTLLVGAACVLLAGASVWRLQDFEDTTSLSCQTRPPMALLRACNVKLSRSQSF